MHTTAHVQTSGDLAGYRRRLIKRLERFRRAVRRQLVLEGVAGAAVLVAGLLLLSLLLDWWFRLSLPMRLACLSAIVAGVAWQVWRGIIIPWRQALGYIDLAHTLDRRRGALARPNGHAVPRAVAPRIASVLQLSERSETPGASAAMTGQAVERSFQSLQGIDFDAHLDTRRRAYALAVIALAVLAPLVVAMIVPSAAGLWARRWFAASNEPWPQKTYLEVIGLGHDRRLIVPRGEPYVLRIATRQGSVVPETVTLTLRPDGARSQSVSMTRFASAGDFRHELLTVATPITVRARGGDDVLEPFVIEPVDRPRIEQLELIATHPGDNRPQAFDFSGQAAPSFLARTKLDLSLTANVPLKALHLKSATTQPSPDALRRVDARHFSLSWVHEAPVSLEVELQAAEGGLRSPPTPIAIGLKVDQPPRVSIQHSGVRLRVTPQAKIPLSLLARDDYGIAQLSLAWKAELDASAASGAAGDPATQPVALSDVIKLASIDAAKNPEIQQAYTMELSPLKLSAGALLTLTGEATDADYLGPRTGRSRSLAFRIVNPQELFREILSRQQGERAKFRKAIDDEKQLRDALQTATSTGAVAAQARQYRLLQREIARIDKSLADSLVEMKLNALGGADAWTLMEQNVLAPLKALQETPMTQQRDTLDALSRSLNDAALSSAVASQDAIIDEMERILKQMAQWDSFVDVINQLNEVIKLQENAREVTEKLRTKETEGIFEP